MTCPLSAMLATDFPAFNMPDFLKKMPTLQGVGAGQTASVTLPLGLTYERLYFYANVDAVPADLPAADFGTYFGEIRILVDGRAVVRINAADLVALNAYKGIGTEVGMLPLLLAQPNMRTPEGEDFTGYGTKSGIQSLSVEIDCKAGQTFNTVSLYAHQSAGKPWGSHYQIKKYTVNQGVTGEKEISDIPRAAYSLTALHLVSSAVDSVQVEADQQKVYEAIPNVSNLAQKIAKRTPQAGYTHTDFLTKNRLAGSIPMVLQDFRVRYNFTGTGNFDLYAERIVGAQPA